MEASEARPKIATYQPYGASEFQAKKTEIVKSIQTEFPGYTDKYWRKVSTATHNLVNTMLADHIKLVKEDLQKLGFTDVTHEFDKDDSEVVVFRGVHTVPFIHDNFLTHSTDWHGNKRYKSKRHGERTFTYKIEYGKLIRYTDTNNDIGWSTRYDIDVIRSSIYPFAEGSDKQTFINGGNSTTILVLPDYEEQQKKAVVDEHYRIYNKASGDIFDDARELKQLKEKIKQLEKNIATDTTTRDKEKEWLTANGMKFDKDGYRV